MSLDFRNFEKAIQSLEIAIQLHQKRKEEDPELALALRDSIGSVNLIV